MPIINGFKLTDLRIELSKGVVRVSYDRDSRLAVATSGDGETIPTVTVFWFAWQAF